MLRVLVLALRLAASQAPVTFIMWRGTLQKHDGLGNSCTMPQVLRVTFLLGNLTVNNNRNRLTIGQKFGGADLFVALIGRYTWKRPSSASSTSARSDSK